MVESESKVGKPGWQRRYNTKQYKTFPVEGHPVITYFLAIFNFFFYSIFYNLQFSFIGLSITCDKND